MSAGAAALWCVFALWPASVRAADPPAPDYALRSAWAALPASGDARLPVFFVHPTTDLSPWPGNAPADAESTAGRRVSDLVMPRQASAFASCCALYAPRYRQASLRAITHDRPSDLAAVSLAYGDVEAAFDEFLRRIGPAQPFVLAGHSQGAIHLGRLLQARVAGQPLLARLVAAYAVGTALPRDPSRLPVPLCDGPQATRCVITWNSVKPGTVDRHRREDALWWSGAGYQRSAGMPLACVNPLDWRPDSSADGTGRALSLIASASGQGGSAPVAAVRRAACVNGALEVDIEPGEARHFSDLLSLGGVLHDFDIALFHAAIGPNVLERAAALRAVDPDRAR